MPRSSGILLHPTSLPARFGIGDLGPAAYRFADWLAQAGQTLWQVLPLGPTGYGDSPYQLFSAFAGNPLLLSPERLRDEGLLGESDLAHYPSFDSGSVEFEQVSPAKFARLDRAFENFEQSAAPSARREFAGFCAAEAWLDDFALFQSLKQEHGVQHVWTDWEPELVTRQPAAITKQRDALARPIEREKFWQWQFALQWQALRAYCRERHIRFMGDVPIYVAHDSADVWANPELFHLDARGNPLTIAGVPPDYFSSTGQRWGNPLYNWDQLRATGFQWWIDRFRATTDRFDLFRLDHFRGFQAYWEIPADEETAINGVWKEAPGRELFLAAQTALGELPIVAENLGVITPAVEAIRMEFGFPGMSILQFAFGVDPQSPDFKPHNFPHHRFAYTGTHDNDTTMGWWNSSGGDSTRSADQIVAEKAHALEYLGVSDDGQMNWHLIRALLASVAAGAVIPAQDVLGLGSESRFNKPGVLGGNWRWRLHEGQLTPEQAHRLHRMVTLYDRN